MKATVVSLTKKKGISWGMADLRTVYHTSAIRFLISPSPTYHLLRPNLGLLVLTHRNRRARHDRWSGSHGRAESGPRERAEKAGVHGGQSGGCGSARCCRGPMGGARPAREELTHWTNSSGPEEMSGDGGAGARGFVVLAAPSAKARQLQPGKSRVT